MAKNNDICYKFPNCNDCTDESCSIHKCIHTDNKGTLHSALKKTTKKILCVVLWFIGFPIIIDVLGIFMWITCLIDFIDSKEVRRK